MVTLGQYIREARDKKDFSLREFAKKIECSPAFLSDIELGKRHPSDELFTRIAQALNVGVGELKKFDTRHPTGDLRALSQVDPSYAFAFRTLLDSKVSAEKLIQFAQKESKSSKKIKRP